MMSKASSRGSGMIALSTSRKHLLFVGFFLVLEVWTSLAFACDFTDSDCGWTWSDTFSLLSAENSSLLGPTAPTTDADNGTKGQFLYYSSSSPGTDVKLEVVSPEFEPGTNPTCALEVALHMYNMDHAVFSIIIKAPNSTWEASSFMGNNAHKWDRYREVIGPVSQPFSVLLEISVQNTVVPSHIALDDLRAVECYEQTYQTTDCGKRQFQCEDLLCIDSWRVCDTVEDCIYGEDEQQDCDKIPRSAFCTFEENTCGWKSSGIMNSTWVRRRGESPNQRTGPSFDHTLQNESGEYMLAQFPRGRSFGEQTTLISPLFDPPPAYHRNPNSTYYNSCQVRFFYHKYGQSMGELRLYSFEMSKLSLKPIVVQLFRSYGNRGDAWRQAVAPLPNITNKFYLQFDASRGVGISDIAIDDVTLSPECFGIGVPENESRWAANEHTEDKSKRGEVKKPNITRIVFGTCGAKGRNGPNEILCNAAYQNSSTKVMIRSWNGHRMEGIQRWIVPNDGIYTLFVNGASGGPGAKNRGKSLGSSLRATFHWIGGEAIYFLVGQKGTDACAENNIFVIGMCDGIDKRDIHAVRKNIMKRNEGGGGGGGGGTYVFKIDPMNQARIPLVIAGGGGGLSAEVSSDHADYINPSGLGINNSISPINGFSKSAAGGGGGWDDTTILPNSGQSLREGGRGGEVCKQASIWNSDGGFGGGGGGCAAGGGGGGYRGGDSSSEEEPYFNGYGGTSYLSPDALRPLVEPGKHEGDGSAVVLPAQRGCGCDYLCVLLDQDYKEYYCICPSDLTLNIDGFSCNGHVTKEKTTYDIPTKIWIVIGLCIIVAIAVFFICFHFGMIRIRKNQHYRDMSNEPLNNPEVQLSRLRPSGGGMVTEYNPNYEFGGSTCSAQDLREIHREQLTLVKALGQGAFGEVYQGFLTNPTDNSEKPVAVKTLPELSSSQSEMDFLMEALIMSKFNHPNIVSFIGVCFEKMPRFIVLELLPGGDLKSYLREHRPKPQKPSTLTISDLLKLALDVARGCQYLEDNHFIHRDIAARNCLLTAKDASGVVKIADFGMARDIYRADYYRKGGKAMLPVKWMPPEAFLDGIFTTKTDVWSFGVLLWEVISLGYMPYPGRGNQEVMQLVTSGGRLEPPTNCPSPVYHIMMQCWHPLSSERPNFNTIIERLGYCLQDPDVINAPLPVFNRPPSMERDATVMRPSEDDSGGCLQVQRPEPGSTSLLSPGSEDYLIPMPNSSYSLTSDRTSDLMSNSSLISPDQLLEMSDRRNVVDGHPSPSAPPRPSTWETNFMTPNTPSGGQISNHVGAKSDGSQQSSARTTPVVNAKRRPGESSTVDSSKDLSPMNSPQVKDGRKPSIRSLDDLPIAPEVSSSNENDNHPPTANSMPLDPSALVRQTGLADGVLPRGYINVDVNFNTGESNGPITRIATLEPNNLPNRNVVPFEGYAGVNPVA